MSVFVVIPVRIFPAFSRIRTEYWEIRSIQSECGENADRNNSEYGHFLRSDVQWLKERKIEVVRQLPLMNMHHQMLPHIQFC